MASGWICGQSARDFVPTKMGRNGSIDITESEEFKTTKFFCKTNFDMKEINHEKKDYDNYPLPIAYKFPSEDAKERILYKNFEQVNQDVIDMIKEIQREFPKSSTDKKKKK